MDTNGIRESRQWTVNSEQRTVNGEQHKVDSGQWTADSGILKFCTLKLFL